MRRNQRSLHAPGYLSNRIFLAFHIPGFKWLWTGNTLAFMARIVYRMAEGWLVLTITDSPFWVGAMAGVRGGTLMLFSPFAGVISDRFDRKKLLIGTQVITTSMALLLAYLIFTDQIRLWHIPLMIVPQGLAQSVNIPARMTLTMDMVGKKALLNATAASHMGNGLVQIISPAIAGFIISAANLGSVYLMVAGAAILAIISMLKIGHTQKVGRRTESTWLNLKGGVLYAYREPKLRSLILLALVVETFGWSHMTMLPVIARDVLRVGATGFGFLSAAAGVGLMVGTLVIASLGDIKSKGWTLVICSAGFGIFIILFAASSWFPLSMLLLAVAVGLGISLDAVLGTLIQTISADHMRGRVMSFYALTFGMTPMGGFGAGAIASFLGAPLAIGIGGGVVAINALRSLGLVSKLRQAD